MKHSPTFANNIKYLYLLITLAFQYKFKIFYKIEFIRLSPNICSSYLSVHLLLTQESMKLPLNSFFFFILLNQTVAKSF